ncbi:hypothetical protein [Kosakonia cowanii]|uniref:hypothetical protein n=1 Tax=Kosakonia cowanii TaxID=208223 RepID=UPI0012FD54C4|nr:hypothetical protein [Kosakonia cowanii]
MKNISYDDPNDILSVSMNIRTASGNISPTIFANGRNQLEVEVAVSAFKDEDQSQPMNFSDETWKSILSLRHAESDEVLNLNGGSEWCYSYIKNEYARELLSATNAGGEHYTQNKSDSDNNSKIIIMYVYTYDVNFKRISVALDTSNGKHFTTSDISTTVETSSVSVKSIQALSYNNGDNIVVIKDGDVHLSDELHYTSHILATSYDHYDGQLLRTIFRLKSSQGYYFLKNSVSYQPYTNNEISDDFDNHWNVRGFGSIPDDVHIGKPCSVIGYSVTDESYDVYMWYSRQNRVAFEGGWLSERWEVGRYYQCYFRTQGIPEDNHIGDDEHGEVTLLLYTFRCWEHNTGKRGWSDANGQAKVNVIDNYGNEGDFSLSFHRNTLNFV